MEMQMQLPIKRAKGYRFQLSDNQVLEVAKAFEERRMLEPSVSGLKLLNTTLTQLGIRIQLTKWDTHHPIINGIESHLLNCREEGEEKLYTAISRGVGYLERIAMALEKKTETVSVKPLKVSTENKTVKTRAKQKNVVQNDSQEDRKELGALLAYSRKELNLSAARFAEIMPKFEPYIDWTGKVRKNLTSFTISHLERGKAWPAAKQLASMVSVLDIPEKMILRICELLPTELKESLKHHNINLLPVDNVVAEEAKQEVEVEEVLENVDKQMFVDSAPIQPQPQPIVLPNMPLILEAPRVNTGLRIGVLGDLGKRWIRPGLNFGDHTVEFIDTDKVRQLNGDKYDYLVHTSFHGHKATNKLGDIPVCKLPNGNGMFTPVRTPKQLMRWLSLWDKSLV
jgi:hypothetical protein